MPPRTRFTLDFAAEVVEHLDAIERKYHRLIQETIDEQLTFAPNQETRNRKPLDRPTAFEASWELRFGPNNRFRVFYQVDEQAKTVFVLAIGVKEGNRLLIGGKEIQL